MDEQKYEIDALMRRTQFLQRENDHLRERIKKLEAINDNVYALYQEASKRLHEYEEEGVCKRVREC